MGILFGGNNSNKSVVDEHPKTGYNSKRFLDQTGKTLFYSGSFLLTIGTVIKLGINLFSRENPKR